MTQKILFLCVANSARSQMAEGLARRLAPAGVEVFSAGSVPAKIHPHAVAALGRRGIDADGQFSKGFADVPIEEVDTVITLCEEEVCPPVPEHVTSLHWPHSDPAAESGAEAAVAASFDGVRDAIEDKLVAFFASR